MKKIIGGLLVATLLTNPSNTCEEKIILYDYKNRASLYSEVKRLDETNLSEADITKLIYDIDCNSRSINSLLKDKFKLVAQIQSLLNQKSRNKESLKEEQMSELNSFNKSYERRNREINSTLLELESVGYKDASKAVFENTESFTALFVKLKRIFEKQLEVMHGLAVLIEIATHTLEMLA